MKAQNLLHLSWKMENIHPICHLFYREKKNSFHIKPFYIILMKEGRKLKYLVLILSDHPFYLSPWFFFNCIHTASVTPPSPFPVDPPLAHHVIPAASPPKSPGANWERILLYHPPYPSWFCCFILKQVTVVFFSVNSFKLF